jgi:hypothetical protein
VFVSVALLAYERVWAQEPSSSGSAATLQQLLTAHRAWSIPPVSIEILGTSKSKSKEGQDVSEPVRIFATGNEEVVIEYGALRDTKSVSTGSAVFKEAGAKTTFAVAPAGFSQLDITGLFLLARIAPLTARIGPAVPAEIAKTPVQKVTISRDRTQHHYGQLKVDDTFDMYIAGNGLLAGIARTFYPQGSSLLYTQGVMFEDYRNTGGVLLPYRIAKYHRGQRVQTIEVSGYQFDLGADPALFTPRSSR